MIDFDKILFRPSSLGDIFTEGKGKDEKFGITCKDALTRMYLEAEYSRTKDITTKYMEKGIEQEECAIDLYSEIKHYPFFKNEKRVQNDFLNGEPDMGDSPDRDI